MPHEKRNRPTGDMHLSGARQHTLLASADHGQQDQRKYWY
jgi:hypothetical protein